MSTAYVKLTQDVCVRLGFCGGVVDNRALHVDQFVPKSGPVTADAFATALFRGEGWEPEGPEARKYRPAVCDAFVRYMGGSEVDASLLS